MDREYLRFLVSELILLKDETLFHIIPETNAKYNEIFGELENYVDSLNLNIRMLRRKIDLVDRAKIDEEIEDILEEEFGSDLNDLELKKNMKFYDKDILEIDEDIKRACKDLYRQVISKLSPYFYKYTEIDFLKFQNAFKEYNLDKLRELCECNAELFAEIKENVNLENIREELEIEISSLYLEFPLNKLEMLESNDAVSFNLDKLKNVYDDYTSIYAKLQEDLNLKLARKIF